MTEKNNITHKACSMCGLIKLASEFYKRRSRASGLTSSCKSCIKKEKKRFKRTKEGLISTIFQDQKTTSKNRGYSLPAYTLEELTSWVTSQKLFSNLFDKWVASGYQKMLRPSVDRDNDYESYRFDNITIMTWQENMDKGHSDRRNGVNNKMNKSVMQSNIAGEPIKQYHSMMQAQRETGIHSGKICACCKKIRKSAGGYRWEYA